MLTRESFFDCDAESLRNSPGDLLDHGPLAAFNNSVFGVGSGLRDDSLFARWPADAQFGGVAALSQAENADSLIAGLVSIACRDLLSDCPPLYDELENGPDRITITFRSMQPHNDRVTGIRGGVC